MNLVGRRFGRWTVLQKVISKGRQSRWMCRCDCGTVKILTGGNLVAGRTNSCGCLQREQVRERSTQHGLSRTPEYRSWYILIDRCYHERCNVYHLYGGKGINVCERWRGKDGLLNFITDMGKKPSRRDHIVRIDKSGDYEPNNCMWSSRIKGKK